MDTSNDKLRALQMRSGNLKRETKPLIIAAQNNTIRMNDLKAKIGNTAVNGECSMC